MAVRTSRALLSCTSGAVAPTVALALVGLIAAGGLAFDYSRLVGMHSELQNAADQAALAAASQLDGKADATKRAANAAANLVANYTLIANDRNLSGRTGQVTIATVVFYQDKARTQVVTRNDSSTTDDQLAHYVDITVGGRRVFYALTPVVSLMTSGDINAEAMAGLGSATCKVPPVMMCNPAETSDSDFTVSNYVGRGIRLIAHDNSYGPGNFGFLDVGEGSGANNLKQALGNVTIPGDCVPDTGVTTEPGQMTSVLDALNTRFDVYANGLNNPCGSNDSQCPPSANSRKDLVMTGGNGNCAIAKNKGWTTPPNPYLPTSSTPYTASTYPTSGISPMGYPRDICHALSMTGSCSGGAIGDGVWDRYAYFASNSTNYPTVPTSAEMTAMFGTDTPTRYQVYRYEMANAATRLQTQQIGSGNTYAYSQPVCVTPGLAPGGNTPDRRRLSVAVVNCTAEGVSGRTTNVKVTKWIDVFLVEPTASRDRTDSKDVYVEVIGQSGSGGDGTEGQVVRRDVPYLVR
jgi:Flp pilus assembly protein TadG